MTDLFAAETTLTAQRRHLFSSFLRIIGVSIFILTFVSAKFAALLIYALFTTAPPNFSAPCWRMNATGPVEVFFFLVIIGAVFAGFSLIFAFYFVKFEFYYLKLESLVFSLCFLQFLIKLLYSLSNFYKFFCSYLQLFEI